MTCREAITCVLRDAARPLRAAAIADEVNRRALYVRTDGRPLPAYQVSSVAHSHPQSFRIAGGLIGLIVDPVAAADLKVLRPSDDSAPPICALIGCVSRKEPSARAAKDLYRTELFSRRRAYAEASGLPWLIVSALHGIVDPDEVLEPYDVRLADLHWTERHALGERVADELVRRFGALEGCSIEVHAGDEYMRTLAIGLRSHGARLVNPVRGLRIGEQLAWYGARVTMPARVHSHVAATGVQPAVDGPTRYPGLARHMTQTFQAGELDLTDAPPPGWAGMPEVIVSDRMRAPAANASDGDVRLLLTFTAAMDRARDADALWFAAERLFAAEPWAFDPQQVVARSLTELADVLRRFRVSQRHGPDAAAWRVIAESLADPRIAPTISSAVVDGHGDARKLLHELQAQSPGGTDRFPFLRGPKVGPMWVRMLAHPGGAHVTSLEVLPVAVDVQVRKVTEYLSVTDTGKLDLESARPLIQAAWSQDVAANGAEGPGLLDGTAAALDPALWFWAKWGCTRCERSKRAMPIGPACRQCRFPSRS